MTVWHTSGDRLVCSRNVSQVELGERCGRWAVLHWVVDWPSCRHAVACPACLQSCNMLSAWCLLDIAGVCLRLAGLQNGGGSKRVMNRAEGVGAGCSCFSHQS